MYIGNTYQEKAQSMDALCRKAKVLGRIFMVFGIFCSFILIYATVTSEGSLFSKAVGFISAFLSPIPAYWGGYFWYFGFLTVKSWFVKRNVKASDVAFGAGTSLAVSYLLGGKKAAKTSLLCMFAIVGIACTIGFWAGLYQYFSIKRQLARA